MSVEPAQDQVVASAWGVLDSIHDPCSVAFGCPLSLVEMGLVKAIEREENKIEVQLQLTEPTCMYAFRIGDEIRSRLQAELGAIGAEVRIAPPDVESLWTEEFMSAEARDRLNAFRRRRAAPQKQPNRHEKRGDGRSTK